jgi:short-subunit dehydrogenase
MSGRTILITGASSGIGAALAKVYAAPGNRLILWARNGERLAAVADGCRQSGAAIATACFDLTDNARLSAALEAADTERPIDLAILNAGLGGSVPPDRIAQDARNAEAMVGVNFTAPVLGANILAERMARRGAGRIVLIGSVAASFPLPMAPVYAGTKAGLAMFAQALQLRLKRHGVGVTLVSPGFVDTPMSRSLTEPKPFLVSPERAAAAIARGIDRGARHIVIPWQFALICFAARFIPGAAVRAVLSRI